jgi:hypothetical protein
VRGPVVVFKPAELLRLGVKDTDARRGARGVFALVARGGLSGAGRAFENSGICMLCRSLRLFRGDFPRLSFTGGKISRGFSSRALRKFKGLASSLTTARTSHRLLVPTQTERLGMLPEILGKVRGEHDGGLGLIKGVEGRM